ncbi:SDR family oxidoreductase [Cognatishimia sp. MH4019]|uniref:SDR family oxidoreductase n=1 Tax=Cognatishimia sp. MH4019 TaxID=2854030 RepID=UPI001CD5495E|nr:SDR family oxidoreductase [Cognatishimia sp. MH4019]
MKTAIVTGASSGIGLATAQALIAAGWTVGVLARREDALAKIEGGIVLPCDVADAEAVQRAFDAFVAQVGRLDLLFNNAGIFVPAAPFDEVPLEDWHASVGVNLNGMFYAARAAFKQMRRQDPQGGRIINNGSISAHSPREGAVCYTTTKHAITGLTRQISLDGRPFDIACGQIDIGNARTGILEDIAEAAQAKGEVLPPMISPEDAANAVVHMAALPLNANVQTMTLMATKMPYVGRG